MQRLLALAEAALPTLTWAPSPNAPAGLRAFDVALPAPNTTGLLSGTVCAFSLDGREHYDGAFTLIDPDDGRMTILRMTPQLAERAFQIASKGSP